MERRAPACLPEAEIDSLPRERPAYGERLSELGGLGTRLVLQRAVDEEIATFLYCAGYRLHLRKRMRSSNLLERSLEQVRRCAR